MIITKAMLRLAYKAQMERNRYKAFNPKDALRIKRWINEKGWQQDMSLQQAADDAGVSKRQMSRYFRMFYRKSFTQWRSEVRINEAKILLLRDKTIPAALVGEAVGINDKSNFRCLFKRATGMTPAQWRLKHKVHIGRH